MGKKLASVANALERLKAEQGKASERRHQRVQLHVSLFLSSAHLVKRYCISKLTASFFSARDGETAGRRATKPGAAQGRQRRHSGSGEPKDARGE